MPRFEARGGLRGRKAIATPRGDPPTVDDIANSVLASDLSSGVTGIALHVDAGAVAGSGFNLAPWRRVRADPAGQQHAAAVRRRPAQGLSLILEKM